MLATPKFAFPYPQDSDPPDGPTQIHALASAVEAELVAMNSGFVRLSGGAVSVSSGAGSTASGTVVGYSEDSDADAMHSTGTNPGRITIPSGKAGVYLLTGQVAFATASGTGLPTATLRANGSTAIAAAGLPNVGTAGGIVPVLGVYSLAVADYVEIIASMAGMSAGVNMLATAAIFTATLLHVP